MIKKWFIFLSLIISWYNTQSQESLKEITIEIALLLDDHHLKLSSSSTDINKPTVTIESLRFYLSNFSFSTESKEVWKEENSYHLIDVSNPSSLKVIMNVPANLNFDHLHFLLGTDSIVNVSGVMGGDLDPTKGMYWAWNSGYINFKIEGMLNQNPFEYHLGGYSYPYSSSQHINLKTNSTNHIKVQLDLRDFFEKIPPSNKHKIMSPSIESVELMVILSQLFTING